MPKALTRRRVGAGLALLVAVAVVLVVVVGNSKSSAGSPNNTAADTAGATTVQRRDLVETDTESGTLSFATPQTVYNNLSGTVTWLPQVGRLIKPGQTLYKVDDVPVMLMNGSTPAYRDLSAADAPGQDILELNRNLVALGFNPDGIVADDTWQAATTDGVDVLQAYLGQTETGDLSLGQVVFLPGPQLVSSLDETLGADPGGGTSAASLSAFTAPARSAEFVDLQTRTTTAPQSTTTGPSRRVGAPPHRSCQTKKGATKSRRRCSGRSSLRALIELLKAELAELKSHKPSPPSGGHPSSSGSPSGNSGSGSGGGGASGGGGGGASGGASGGGGGGTGGAGGGTAVLETTSTELVATVDLDPSKQSEAKVGDSVTVEMPAGNPVGGRITAVSSVAQSSSGGSGSGSGGSSPGGGDSGSGSSSAIPVTIALTRRPKAKGLDQAAVSVNFDQAEAKHVLSVPVTALLAVPGGGYAIQQSASPQKLVPVTTGLFAAGYVQISGSGVYQGLQVTNSEG
ncbi:MAG TPA: hypothetical protein VGF70_05470 [Solirubrobacteraceae bacterium]